MKGRVENGDATVTFCYSIKDGLQKSALNTATARQIEIEGLND